MSVTKRAPDLVRKLIKRLERAGLNVAQFPDESNTTYVARLRQMLADIPRDSASYTFRGQDFRYPQATIEPPYRLQLPVDRDCTSLFFSVVSSTSAIFLKYGGMVGFPLFCLAGVVGGEMYFRAIDAHSALRQISRKYPAATIHIVAGTDPVGAYKDGNWLKVDDHDDPSTPID